MEYGKQKWKSYNTTKSKAQSQYKLLNYVGCIKGEILKNELPIFIHI